jgi:hypothetical protein
MNNGVKVNKAGNVMSFCIHKIDLDELFEAERISQKVAPLIL